MASNETVSPDSQAIEDAINRTWRILHFAGIISQRDLRNAMLIAYYIGQREVLNREKAVTEELLNDINAVRLLMELEESE